MTINIHIPDEIETTLRDQVGNDLEQLAKEDLAASWFRDGRITSRQVAEFLGLSLFEAHAFLKRQGVTMPMTLEDVEEDLATLRESQAK